MVENTPRRREKIVAAPIKEKCDNHPDVDAVLVTTSNRKHSEIKLCEDCTPRAWRE